ncbi:MAG: UpxY family transcription antiterminator [Bacteroidetes bacterium]|nr:UpxY family transcription antiterminator [Bacteroidota bacterium]
MENSPDWFAFYTLPRAEKKVAETLELLQFEHFLPLKKTLKQWSDRKKMVIEPVFRSYIFVKVTPVNIKKVVAVEGILKVIHFGSVPQKIPENQIVFLKILLESPDEIEIQSNLQTGDKVRVSQGPLVGAEGYLMNNNAKNFVVNIDIVGHSVSIKVNPAYLEKIIN